MSPTELWLPVGAAAFYLYDSCILLWHNELVFLRGRDWQVSGGSELRLAGRRIFMPNPLLPARPQFVVRWSVADKRAAGQADDPALLPALRAPGVIVQLQLVLLLALPIVSWTLGAGIVMLGLFALFYLLTLLALALLWPRRARCGLQPRAFWMLALDALACAPFAVNLVRKVAMRHGLAGDPLRFAACAMDARTRDAIALIIAARLQQQQAEATTPRGDELGVLMSRLEPGRCDS